MKIGLYFGSFNPIHIGHLIIAQHMLDHCQLNQVWFVVSPHNPLKESKSLLNENNRLHLVRLAIEEQHKFRASSVEFTMPRPSYTIDTLTYLSDKYPKHEFSIIMGSDSLENFPKWKNYEQILKYYPILVYNRPNTKPDKALLDKVQIINAPLLDISATYIRNKIANKQSILYLVPKEVMVYIEQNGYYKA
jgi:nicotinate-nucleotide adenylyltransferase